MTLLQTGKFISHSGKLLNFKIDCDALTDEDIECIAEFIASKIQFSLVDGIPTGGNHLMEALKPHRRHVTPFCYLIVDDVLTTGKSMENQKADILKDMPLFKPNDIIGWVIFARTETPDWINAMFRLYDE